MGQTVESKQLYHEIDWIKISGNIIMKAALVITCFQEMKWNSVRYW